MEKDSDKNMISLLVGYICKSKLKMLCKSRKKCYKCKKNTYIKIKYELAYIDENGLVNASEIPSIIYAGEMLPIDMEKYTYYLNIWINIVDIMMKKIRNSIIHHELLNKNNSMQKKKHIKYYSKDEDFFIRGKCGLEGENSKCENSNIDEECFKCKYFKMIKNRNVLIFSGENGCVTNAHYLELSNVDENINEIIKNAVQSAYNEYIEILMKDDQFDMFYIDLIE